MQQSQGYIMDDRCALCGCEKPTEGTYAENTPEGRAFLSKAHCVAKRLKKFITDHPWRTNNETIPLCYECHEELLHNPVLFRKDIDKFADLMRKRGINEKSKPKDYNKISKRIELYNEVIRSGLDALLNAS